MQTLTGEHTHASCPFLSAPQRGLLPGYRGCSSVSCEISQRKRNITFWSSCHFPVTLQPLQFHLSFGLCLSEHVLTTFKVGLRASFYHAFVKYQAHSLEFITSLLIVYHYYVDICWETFIWLCFWSFQMENIWTWKRKDWLNTPGFSIMYNILCQICFSSAHLW